MKTRLALVLSLFAAWGIAPNLPADQAPSSASARKVYVLPIRQEIEPPLVLLVRRGVKEALEAKADLLVLDMKTDGGRIDVTEEIIDILKNFKGETVTYVNNRAFSAGSFISVSTKKIYMAPQSVIGAAAPIMLSPGGTGVQDMPSTVEVKMTAAVAGLVRGEAEKNGYNTDVIQAMIDKNHDPLVMDGKTLCPKGQLLVLTDPEASAKYGNPPKPLLSSGTVESLDALLKMLGYGDATRVNIEPSTLDVAGAWINTISPILLIIGLVGLYIEFKNPGMLVPGVVAVCAFLLYFLGGYIASLSGMLWIVVFIVGVVLVASELIIHPGTILPGVVGVALILTALIMAMTDVYPGGPPIPSLPQMRVPLDNLMIAFAATVITALILGRFLPKTPLYRTLVSQTASGTVSVEQLERRQTERVGLTGFAISSLRPGGKARFGDDILDVITRGEMLEKGRKVKIVGSSGTEAVVEAEV